VIRREIDAFRVSLSTTRRACADLECAGLLVRRQGSGTCVAEVVETATREQALAEVGRELGDAVGRARRLVRWSSHPEPACQAPTPTATPTATPGLPLP